MSISNLYQKYLDNACSPEELQTLLSHFEKIDQEPELREMTRNELQRINSSYERLPQVNNLLNKLDLVVHRQIIQNKPKQMKLLGRYRYWSAAAIFLILSIALYYGDHKLNIFNSYASEYKNDVAPGSDKAILTLADGSEINLTDTLQGTLAAQSGVTITKNKAGEVRYQISASQEDAARSNLNTISTPKGGKFEVVLSDGTRVFLNAASSISFPSTFSSKGDRRVTLTGEGYFEVAHRAAQPFYVQSGDQLLRVLGTHFNVNAYTDEKSVKTTLLEGAVQVAYSNGRQTVLKPGQQSHISNGQLLVDEINAESATDWQRGEMGVEDEDFQATMRKIARWYDVEVVFAADAPRDLKLGGIISRDKSIVTVLKVMELTGEVHFKVEGRRVTVMR